MWDLRMRRTLVALVIILVVGLILALGGLVVAVVKAGERLNQTLAKVDQTLTQVSRTSQLVGTSVKNLDEQLTAPEEVLVRRNAQKAVTAALQHLTYVTLPGVDETVRTARGTVERVGESTDELVNLAKISVGESTKLIQTSDKAVGELSGAVQTELQSTNKSLNALTDSLQNLTQSTTLTVNSTRERIESIKSQQELIDGVLVQVEGIGVNLKEATGDVAKMSKYAKKWQPLVTVAQLVRLGMLVW